MSIGTNAPQASRHTKKDFESDQDVRWCPGCGDYAILSTVQKMMPDLGVPRENVASSRESAAPVASRTT